MPDSYHLLLFVLAGWLLNLTPGPDVLYIVTNSLRGGWRAGIVAALGITAGCFVHVFAAAMGVGALLAASATAFTALKWASAAYLLWLGAKTLLRRAPQADDVLAIAKSLPLASWRGVFLGGFWTNVLNPKVVLFFLAFLPQFSNPETSASTAAFLALGTFFVVNSLPINAGWAAVASYLAGRPALQQNMRRLDKVAGAMFVLFAVRLALVQRPID